MFVVEALYPFSALVIQQPTQQLQANEKQQKKQQSPQQNQVDETNIDTGKRMRSKSQEKQLQNQAQQKQQKNPKKQNQKQQEAPVKYLTFEKEDKILVIQSYQNGWWYGNTISNPDQLGFFPSNYVRIPIKSKPPPPPPLQKLPSSEEEEEQIIYDPNEKGVDWVQNELKNFKAGPVDSSYYLGIKGYKNVKIDEKNQNILKGNNVKFDVSTGLAKVPIKDQAPAAKSVRQMGYYFDYHQWTEQRNKNPNKKSRPDIRKKKAKTLKLKGMD